MLQFTTKDIVKRARELADLENSDFISWSENMKLLDESYKKLYQETINVNDKYYLKTITLKDLIVTERKEKEVRLQLPSDFYQLASIHIAHTGTQILRKAKTEDNSASRYDIINDTLVLYGGAPSLRLELDYYPVPKTLTLKNDVTSASISGKVLDCNKNKYLTYDSEEETLTVYDLNNGLSKTIDISSIPDTISTALLGVKNIILFTSGDTRLIDIAGGNINPVSSYYGKKDGILLTINASNMVEDEYGRPYFEVVLPSDITLGDVFTCDEASTMYYYSDDTGFIFSAKTDGTVIDEELVKTTEPYKFQIINDNLYYVNNGVYRNDTLLVDYEDFDTFYGFNKVDYDTGYGVSCGSIYSDDVMVFSCFEDTQLNFPNNFYFSYLAYMLAIAYKQKQNADATFLIQRASEEFAQFLTSISRDVAENNRIQNVYNGGNYYYG